MATQEKTAARSRRTTTAKDEQHEGAATVSPEEQGKIAKEMAEAQNEQTEAMSRMEQTMEELPERIAEAFTARRSAEDVESKKERKEEMEEAAEAGVKHAVQNGVEEGRNFVVRAAKGTWNVLKPRRPQKEDIQPIVYSNVISWGGAYVLSQTVPGVGDFLCEMFSQGGDAI